MSTLFREKWPLGWQPNSDEFNGNPLGLLRADNLTQDEDGVLSLIRGTKKISSGPFSGLITELFSVTMNLAAASAGLIPDGAKIRYAAINGGQTVLRNFGGTFQENVYDLGIISSGGSQQGVAFGFAFGHVFILSGAQKWKDDGIVQTPIGMGQANTPVISVNPPPTIYLSPLDSNPNEDDYTEWEAFENESVFTAHADYCVVDSNASSFRASALRGLTNAFSLDAMKLGGIANTGTDEDIFSFSVRISDTSKFVRVQVTFFLKPLTLQRTSIEFSDYYELDWNIQNPRESFVEPTAPDYFSPEDRIEFIEAARREFETAHPIELNTAFNLGEDVWSKLQCKRSDFFRVGTDDSLNWKDIHGIRVTFVDTIGDRTYAFADLKFEGGSNGPLTGTNIVYRQVDVQDNSFFLEKSLASNASVPVDCIKTSTQVSTSVVHPQANECWIFRAGGSLNGYYRVKRLIGAKGFNPGTFTDNYSDVDALRDNIKLDDFQSNLPDDIHGLATNFKGRNWYINYSSIFPSYRDNYSAYDTRYVLEVSGEPVEFNLFITKLTNDILILATNVDFYQITGSAGTIIQGDVEFFDINITPMGIKSPAISRSFTVREGNLFYLAADGVRVLSGSNCLLLSDGIDLLLREHNRHGIAPARIETNLTEYYYIAISKGRLFFSTIQKDNKRALYVLELATKLWRYEEHGDTDSISALFSEADDTVIYGTASFGDKFLRILDTGTKFNEVDNIPFKFLTLWDHNGQPRNRKDSFIFKIIADSGNKPITVTVRGFTGADVTVYSNITRIHTEVLTFAGKQEKHFSIYDTLQTVKYYQIEISGSTDFLKIFNFSIDYDPRPEQLSVLRIPPTNFGIAGRKRIYEIPFIIDTLGNAIEFTPVLDGISQTTSMHGTNDKTVSTHLFIDEKAAFNVGGILRGTLFEFYELIQPREIELLPDPIRYKFIPYTNLGSGSRKRFIQYAIVIDTRGSNVTMTPIVDNVNQPPQIINTNRKQTIIYTFDGFAIGVDIACKLQGLGSPSLPFEFYEVNLQECISEKLPPIASHYHIPNTNFGTSSRKRIMQFAFVIDTHGIPIVFTPIVDGVVYPNQFYTTNFKQTCIYTFDQFAIGIDLSGTLISTGDFEFYGVNLEDSVYEKLPPISSHYVIPYNNLGTTSRKRISQFAFVIDTFGNAVLFTPKVDGVSYSAQNFTTSRKETVIYTFESSVVGVDIGGTLASTNDFEFYGLNLEDAVYEKLPAKVQFYEISTTNYGVAAKKRIRTIPMVIDTFGSPVVYTPIVDGIPFPSSTFTTIGKRTVLHYFEYPSLSSINLGGSGVNANDGIPFAIDYGGTLQGTNDFEFYTLLQPENVELLPVGKKFDQFGPIEFSKAGKIREISILMLATGNNLNWRIYSADTLILNGIITTTPNIERNYILGVPKGINPNIFRMEIDSQFVFHRFKVEIRINIDGAVTENKRIQLGADGLVKAK